MYAAHIVRWQSRQDTDGDDDGDANSLLTDAIGSYSRKKAD